MGGKLGKWADGRGLLLVTPAVGRAGFGMFGTWGRGLHSFSLSRVVLCCPSAVWIYLTFLDSLAVTVKFTWSVTYTNQDFVPRGGTTAWPQPCSLG